MAGTLKQNLEIIEGKLRHEVSQYPGARMPLILAVSKKQPVEKVRDLFELGITDFGENYLQEALEKKHQLNELVKGDSQKIKNLRWHFIGPLQSKKIKDIVGEFDLIQSVCREKEINLINQVAGEKTLIQDILIQVNIAGESTKSGVSLANLDALINKADEAKNVNLKGLMFFPPLEDNEKKSLQWFEKCSHLFYEKQVKLPQEMEYLSMGTSQDYHLAARCASTLVRLGECLLGPRSDY